VHGGVAEEVEGVVCEFDVLVNELHRSSERAVQLDASFLKNGYT
jgi:hypothetical protein